ncbi:hypothetical protein GCM10022221_61220 [Actinocorallia aurea]
MVTPQHEALHRGFQEDTGLVARVLENVLHLALPTFDKIEVLNVDLTDLEPVSRWPDTLLRLESAAGPLVVIVESQTDTSTTKRRRWARYIAHLQDVYDCDVSLVVTCRKAATARWAAEPFKIGPAAFPAMIVIPLVLGPDNVPVITTYDEALRDIPLTIFSALIHGESPNAGAILEVLADVLATIDPRQAGHLAEFTEGGLGQGPARQKWRTLMATKPYTYVSETRAQGIKAGRSEQAVKSLLLVLDGRGVTLSDEQRLRITETTDVEQVNRWIVRAATAERAEDIFG